MKKLATVIFGVLVAACLVGTASAKQYPPGPGGLYPDTLTLFNLNDPTAVPHPVPTDTVYGIRGIVTGFDEIPTGFGLYIQNSSGAPWGGIDLFSGATNKRTLLGLNRGDSVVVYGKMQAFGGLREIEGYDGSQSTDDIYVYKINSGNALPPFHVGSVHDLYELLTNTSANQWMGMLVKVLGPLRVARRTNPTNSAGLNTNNSFLAVDNVVCPPGSPGPCDSLFVDGNTLTTLVPPALGAVVDSVQGIYGVTTRGYRIQLRDGDDLFDASPVGVTDAYMVDNTKIRVTFDRTATQASIEDVNNYQLSSLGTINSATMDAAGRAVILDVDNGLAAGDPEGVSVNGIVRASNNVPMSVSASRNFVNGILTCAQVQAPSPDSLARAAGCIDVTQFLGGAAGAGTRLTVKGTMYQKISSGYYIHDEAGGNRSGLQVFAPSTPMQVGRQYIIAAQVVEFPSPSSGETEVQGTAYIADVGAGTLPTAVVEPVGVLQDTTCDATQSILNGEDFEGMLVKISYAKIVPFNGAPTVFTAGGSFRVAGPLPACTDTILIANGNPLPRTYLPVLDHVVDVTGVQQFSFGVFRVQPRGDADIVDHGPGIVSAPNTLPSTVQFSVSPNPARTANISFALPVRNTVDLAVFDVSGRKVATLASGTFEAGKYLQTWKGLDDAGNPVGSGMFFYRLKVGTQQFVERGIRLN